MIETLRGLQTGTVHPRPQDDSRSTLAPLLKKEDGLIKFSRSAIEICNRLRGFQPWPGAFASFRGKNLHVWAARPAATVLPPGDMKVDGDRLLVGCGQGTSVEILELQPEGKKRMSARDFIHGYHPTTGEKLG